MNQRKEFKIRDERLQVFSSGGGTQSCAMIVLMAMGRLPKPDLIVMVDTEREVSEVFDYQRKYIAPICDQIGVEHHIIKKSDYTRDDVARANDPTCVLPGFFIAGDDQEGKMPGYCSSHWKREPFRRHVNKVFGLKEANRRGVDVWLGMSLDEPRRIKVPMGKWQNRYPLFEMLYTRQMSIQLVEDYGLPTPPRSACWACPNRTDDEWIWMKENQPQDFKAAIQFERNELPKYGEQYRLHRSCQYIDEVKFKPQRRGEQMDLVQFCDTGMCFV